MDKWGADKVRMIDPSCGSGHFLLAGLRRIVERMRKDDPRRPMPELVRDALSRVHGVDINDYAAALARARLVMTALELCELDDIREARRFKPFVYWADGLEQVEREKDYVPQQTLFGDVDEAPVEYPGMTPKETRRALAPHLKKKYHVVVGNPPYIVERDNAKKKYHRGKIAVGKSKLPRYVSAYRQYSLVCPFIERCGQIALRDAQIGMIVGNQFATCEYGVRVVTNVLAYRRLRAVIDTSGATIPGHGTPTMLLFWQNKSPPTGDVVLAIRGVRGDPPVVPDPAKGPVWSSIRASFRAAERTPPMASSAGVSVWKDDHVSASWTDGTEYAVHPWTVSGGGSEGLRKQLEGRGRPLSEIAQAIGRTVVVGDDGAFIAPQAALERAGLGPITVGFVTGDNVRDWRLRGSGACVYPYESPGGPPVELDEAALRWFWPRRTLLRARTVFGRTLAQQGRRWYEHLEHYRDRLRTPESIAFAFVCTHNNFAFDSSGFVFKHSAPVIKLPRHASQEDYLALTALLNSSIAGFWIWQVAQPKGAGADSSGGRKTGAAWENFFQLGVKKLARFPVVRDDSGRLAAFGSAISELAAGQNVDSAVAVLDAIAHQGAEDVRTAFLERRERVSKRLSLMTGLQEEVDWHCYQLYGLEVAGAAQSREGTDTELQPGQRPFEFRLVRDAAVQQEGNERESLDWFQRHGWTDPKHTGEIDDAEVRSIVESRIDATEDSAVLASLERPEFKRRWYRPAFDEQETEACTSFLAGQLEGWGNGHGHPFTARQAAAALESDAAVRAVAEVLTGRRDTDLEALFRDLIDKDCVPLCKAHIYKPAGQTRRVAWERTWALQHREDAGEDVGKIPVPPKYKSSDFLSTSYWKLRGKLDVPKERFIHLSEVPGATGDDALFGWAGWTPRQRARVLSDLDEALEDRGVPIEDRHGIFWSLQQQIPFVRWESEAAAAELQDIVTEYVGKVSDEMLATWAERFPPPRGGGRRKRRKKA